MAGAMLVVCRLCGAATRLPVSQAGEAAPRLGPARTDRRATNTRLPPGSEVENLCSPAVESWGWSEEAEAGWSRARGSEARRE